MTTPDPRFRDDASEPPRRRGGVGPFSRRQLGITFGIVVATAALLVVITRPLGTVDGGVLPNPLPTAFLIGEPEVGLRPGDRAPEFEVTLDDGTTVTLQDLDGRPVQLTDLRGKVVWVNFWATWCPPCQFETPILRQTWEAYRDRGLVLVAINVQETTEAAAGYADRYGLTYPIGADVTGRIFHAYRVFALPTQFIIDTDGVIREVVNGPVTLEGAARRIEALLPASSGYPRVTVHGPNQPRDRVRWTDRMGVALQREEQPVTTLFVRHKVIDYPAWRQVYDDFDATRRKMGVTNDAVYRAPDDPRDVTVTHDFANLDAAQAFADSRELAEAMSKAGVDGKPNLWFAEPV